MKKRDKIPFNIEQGTTQKEMMEQSGTLDKRSFNKQTLIVPNDQWWNREEDGFHCLLCNEAIPETDKHTLGGYPTFIMFINGTRKIGALHKSCYYHHLRQMIKIVKGNKEDYRAIAEEMGVRFK